MRDASYDEQKLFPGACLLGRSSAVISLPVKWDTWSLLSENNCSVLQREALFSPFPFRFPYLPTSMRFRALFFFPSVPSCRAFWSVYFFFIF
uniref:Transmembrane protein n=1 Tax=Rhipicephalus zambeziensis TaxID=60191 RepID=A0A224Y8J5_9ACAR